MHDIWTSLNRIFSSADLGKIVKITNGCISKLEHLANTGSRVELEKSEWGFLCFLLGSVLKDDLTYAVYCTGVMEINSRGRKEEIVLVNFYFDSFTL